MPFGGWAHGYPRLCAFHGATRHAPAPDSMEERVHSMVLRLAAEHTAMSPLCWIAGNTGPMLLTHGARDSERVIRSNQRLRALLQLQPAPVDSVVESGHDHFQTHTMLRDADHPWHARLHQLTQTEKP